MRGVTATQGDFYFSPASVTGQLSGNEQSGAPASPTSANPSTLGQMTGGGATAPKSKLGSVNLIPGLSGVNPLWFIPIGLGLLVILKIVRETGHKSGDFHTLKADGYWFVMTVGAAVVGIPLVKAIFNKYQIQPITDYVNNA